MAKSNRRATCWGCWWGCSQGILCAWGICRDGRKVTLHTERACLKLVFSALWQTSQRWRSVRMAELERQPLALLRRELGLPLYPGQEAYIHR